MIKSMLSTIIYRIVGNVFDNHDIILVSDTQYYLIQLKRPPPPWMTEVFPHQILTNN